MAKVAGNESIDGRMMAFDDEIGWRATTQQPTNEGVSKAGVVGCGDSDSDGSGDIGDATARRRDGDATATVMEAYRQRGAGRGLSPEQIFAISVLVAVWSEAMAATDNGRRDIRLALERVRHQHR